MLRCTSSAERHRRTAGPQIARSNNINIGFNFTGVGFTATTVRFDWVDLGGVENLIVNGSPVFIGELDTPPAVLGGASVSTVSGPVLGGDRGTTTVTVNAMVAAGNASSGTFTITVKDTPAPALTLPASWTTHTGASNAVPGLPASDALIAVVRQAMEICGGVACFDEFGLIRHHNDLFVTRVGEGSNFALKDLIVRPLRQP